MALRIVRSIPSNLSSKQRSIILLGTLERFCQSNGTWAMPISPDIQCKSCVGDGRPVKVDIEGKFIFIDDYLF